MMKKLNWLVAMSMFVALPSFAADALNGTQIGRAHV